MEVVAKALDDLCHAQAMHIQHFSRALAQIAFPTETFRVQDRLHDFCIILYSMLENRKFRCLKTGEEITFGMRMLALHIVELVCGDGEADTSHDFSYYCCRVEVHEKLTDEVLKVAQYELVE
jgi:hypothetical protein